MVCSHPLYPGAEVLALDLPCLVSAPEAAVPLAAPQGVHRYCLQGLGGWTDVLPPISRGYEPSLVVSYPFGKDRAHPVCPYSHDYLVVIVEEGDRSVFVCGVGVLLLR